MMEWLSTKLIAEARGISVQAVIQKATRENWQSRPRKGRGGGLEYHITSLPPETRAALIAREVASTQVPADVAPQAAKLPVPKVSVETATRAQLTCALARAGLCRAIERIAAHGGMSVTAACAHLADMLHAGKAEPSLVQMAAEANDKPRAGHVVAARTLLSWHRTFTIFGQNGLIPGKKQKDLSVPPWAGAFLRRYQIPSKPSVNDAYRLFKADLNGDAPSVHQVRRFLNKLSPEAREQGRMGARELKTIQPFRRRSFDSLRPNDVWSADGHTFDAEISHPFYPNRVFRPEITTYADIRTRRIVGWSVDLAESGQAVLDGLRMGIESCGAPAVLYVDNGRGYTNTHVVSAAERLGITLTHSLPYNSQARGVVERLHQSVWVALAKRLPSYIGADMDAEAKTRVFKITRKALKDGVAHRAIIGWDVFLSMAQAAVDEYNARAHASLGGLSPNEVLARFEADGWRPEMLDEAVLRALLMPSVPRKVLRGEVRLFNRRYAHASLGEHHGDEVLVHFDLRDARQVWVHDLSGRLICEATLDGNASAYFPSSFLEDARERRERAQVRRGLEKIERITGREVAGIAFKPRGAVIAGWAEAVAAGLEDARTQTIAREPEPIGGLCDPAWGMPDVVWATDMPGRWRQYQAWKGRDDLNAEQAAWVRHYERTEEYARALEFFSFFEENAPSAAGA